MTLKKAWEDLSGFLAIFFLVFGAFVQMFWILLFSQVSSDLEVGSSLKKQIRAHENLSESSSKFQMFKTRHEDERNSPATFYTSFMYFVFLDTMF